MLVIILSNFICYAYGDLYISTAQEFLLFSDNVTTGTNTYSGETVYITDDLDFDGLEFEPAGLYPGDFNYSKSFLGNFNGNGHLIKNIHYEDGDRWDVAFVAVAHGNSIFENVVIESSCLFNNTYIKEFSSTAGVLGYVSSEGGPIRIRNCINMGGVIYSGPDYAPTLGNVVAYIEGQVEVKNCVGAGWTISKSLGFVGGITGYSWASMMEPALIENCFWDIDTYILNSLSLKIVTAINNSHPYNVYQQIIQSLSYGHSTNNVIDITDGEDTGRMAVATDDDEEEDRKKLMYSYIANAPTLLETLLENVQNITYPKLNLNVMGGVQIKPLLLTVVKELPTPSREGFNFAGWYDDPTYKTPFVLMRNKTSDVAYAKWVIGTYYVLFEMNINDGDPHMDPIAAQYKSMVTLPNPSKKNHKFVAWCLSMGCLRTSEILSLNTGLNGHANLNMPGHNVTLYPKWKEGQSSEKKALITAIVVCAVAVIIAISAVIGTIMIYEEQRKKRVVPNMTVLPDGTITLDSGYFLASNIDLSNSVLVKSFTSFPVVPDVTTLGFDNGNSLKLDVPYQHKFLIKNVSRTKLNWEIFPGNVDKYTLIFNPDRGIISKVYIIIIINMLIMIINMLMLLFIIMMLLFIIIIILFIIIIMLLFTL